MTPRRFHPLQAFSALMHGGSVTRAAEMLSLSQPAVTKLLRALEDEPGLSLLDRRHRRLVPTHEVTSPYGVVRTECQWSMGWSCPQHWSGAYATLRAR